MRSRIRRLTIGVVFFFFLALSNFVAFKDWKVAGIGIQDAEAIVFLCNYTVVVCGISNTSYDACIGWPIVGAILCPCQDQGC